ncbi:MAG: hypothetical protein JXB10_04060, partial [Pirellulales bacterium]|nr:hypothetical protein [Pirellulales bacterium]
MTSCGMAAPIAELSRAPGSWSSKVEKCTVGVPVGWFFGSVGEGVVQQISIFPCLLFWGRFFPLRVGEWIGGAAHIFHAKAGYWDRLAKER